MKPGSSFITGLLAGVAIGGALGLLFAPGSGKETREQIKNKFKDLEKEFEALRGKAATKSDNIRKDLTDKLADLQKEMENLSKSI